MLKISEFTAHLASRLYWLMDGAIGTELERRGYETHLPFWTAYAAHEAPDTLRQIYTDYLDAGCDILTTNTFRVSHYLFEKYNRLAEFKPLLHDTCVLVRDLIPADSLVLLAASITTLEDCYRPDLVPPKKELLHHHSKELEALCSNPVDFILAETINTISEANILLELTHKMQLPFILSIITNGKGGLLSGEPITRLMDSIDRYLPIGISINCRSSTDIQFDAQVLADCHGGIKGAYANAPGLPDPKFGWNPTPDACKTISNFGREMLARGFTILGGCCGTTPQMLKAMKDGLQSIPKIR